LRRSAKFFTAILIFSLSLISMACKYGLDEVIYRRNSFRYRSIPMTELDDSPTQAMLSSLGSKYSVLIISDMHYGKSGKSQHEEALLSWIDSLPASKRPSFCINLGDTADHGLEDEFDDYIDFELRLKSRIPYVYNIVGNHDLYNSGWDEWESKMYPHTSFYHFATGGLSWYFLDSGSGTLGTRQVEELADAMKNDSKPKIVSLHYPVYSDKINMLSCGSLQDEHEVNTLITIFKKYNVKMILDGHTHRYFMNDLSSFTEFNVSTMMDGCSFGVLSVDETSGSIKGEGQKIED